MAAVALIATIGVVVLRVGPRLLRPSSQAGAARLQPGSGAGRQPSTSAVRSSGSAVVTPSTAATVLHRYWPIHERALVGRDLGTLSRLSTGPARAWEQPAVRCGCLSVQAPRPLLKAVYFVPRQTRYPATFVAEALTRAGGQYWVELLVFTKGRAGARWLVSEDSGFAPAAGTATKLGGPVRDGRGFDKPVPAALHARARVVAKRLAALWQQAKDTGIVRTDSGFLLQGQTGFRVASLAAHPQDTLQPNGLRGHFTFYVSPKDPLVEVTDTAGYDLACQPIRETATFTGVNGALPYQDPAQRNWGPELPSGVYREIVDHDVWQTCFVIASNRSRPVVVLNQDIGGSTSVGIH